MSGDSPLVSAASLATVVTVLQHGSAAPPLLIDANRSRRTARDPVQERLQRDDAFAVAIDAMLPGRDLARQFGAPFPGAAERTRNCDELIDRPRRGPMDSHHLQDRGRMPAPHHLADERDDGNIVG